MAKEDQRPFDSLSIEEKLGLIEEVLSGQPTTIEKVGAVALAALGFLIGQNYLNESKLQNELQKSADPAQKWETEQRLRQTRAQFKARFKLTCSVMDTAKRSPENSFILDNSPLGQQVREIAKWAKPITKATWLLSEKS